MTTMRILLDADTMATLLTWNDADDKAELIRQNETLISNAMYAARDAAENAIIANWAMQADDDTEEN